MVKVVESRMATESRVSPQRCVISKFMSFLPNVAFAIILILLSANADAQIIADKQAIFIPDSIHVRMTISYNVACINIDNGFTPLEVVKNIFGFVKISGNDLSRKYTVKMKTTPKSLEYCRYYQEGGLT